MNDMSKMTLLVTGGGSGIGLAVARLFLERKAKVAIAGRNADKLHTAAAELGSADRLLTHQADLADPVQAKQLIETVTARFGRIDILVNNAGMNIKERTFRQLTPATWQAMLKANLDSSFYCTHFTLPQMLARKDGLIVNISSVAGKRANPLGGPAYVAAKFGVTGLGLCLAAEEKDSGIRVSNIYPGEVDTPILEHRPAPVTPEQRAKILKPEDVAQAVLFIAALPPRAHVPELIIKPTAQVYY